MGDWKALPSIRKTGAYSPTMVKASNQIPTRRYYVEIYYVEIEIHDNLMNSGITIPAKTDSFNSLITGLAEDLGSSISGMITSSGGMEKLIDRAQTVARIC
ncbi:hypothetical protein EKN56_16875 [Limnobaculum zhutongyuii]|uniref:Uncharacterized protein n=1 Tax=Limnobaculum zhutongyuii TaxID=2498113 RepID=A0A411WNV2_9GAMM|nr:hypothetical protein [Limnobaculum zhutongyuii]QBH97923.1 hypothetical protein EKN56_16875 [Limnobaculum zhutongyuii]TQS88219.1 hypothetical protein ELQ32_11985 [Limnobaculum zhutongyuii]